MLFWILVWSWIITTFQLFSSIKKVKNKFLLWIIGIINWFSLWVCANCSTPIWKSLLACKFSPIVAINTIISSPSFNIVWITLLFTIFPWYIATLKILFYTLITIIIVPIIFKNSNHKNNFNKNADFQKDTIKYDRSIISIFFIYQTKNLFFIIKKTLPSMLLWWFIWILIISSIPQDLINNLDQVSLLPVILISTISFLLPVPMLFDIVFAGIIYNSSIPSIYAIIILFNLWWFSIYPFLVLKQNIKIFHLYLFSFTFISLSIIFSYCTYLVKNHIDKVTVWNLANQESHYDIEQKYSDVSKEYIESLFAPKHVSNNFSPNHVSINNIHSWVLSQDFIQKEKTETLPPLQFIENTDIWIWFHGYKLWSIMHGVWISDYNNDGYDDLIFGSSTWIKIYKNLWWYFSIDNTINLWNILSTSEVVLANFYDIDGDEWKDLIVSTKNYWYFIMWNNKWNISINDSLNFPKDDSSNSNYSISLWDIYNNGTIDIFFWEYNFWNRSKWANNAIVINNWNRDLHIYKMESVNVWSTFSSLIWDFDNDGKNEIYEGNDGWDASNFIYKASGWNIIPHPKMQEILPYTSVWTKGISIWDIDNDLVFDYFISWNKSFNHKEQHLWNYEDFCQHPNKSPEYTFICWIKYLIKDFAFNKYINDSSNNYINELITKLTQIIHINEIDNLDLKENICNSIKDSYHFWSLYKHCLYKKNITLSSNKIKDLIPQKNGSVLFSKNSWENILYNSINQTIWWAWWSIFLDIHNTWEENLYIWNWHIWTYPITSNKVISISNGTLQDITHKVWWENFLNTISVTTFDIENDGDLDIITISDQWDIVIYKNHSYINNSIAIQLIDKQSFNSEGVWSKILIEDILWNKQIKPVYIWGWPLSLQSTTTYFWIWDSDSIKKITVYWSDNTITEIDSILAWNKKYSIIK